MISGFQTLLSTVKLRRYSKVNVLREIVEDYSFTPEEMSEEKEDEVLALVAGKASLTYGIH